MTMFTICQEILVEGKLRESIDSLSELEAIFTSEIGVIDRQYYQCEQQPHILWANTEWISEKHHNIAARGLMKVREDDRVASAYFRPGLYYEIFALPVDAAFVTANAPRGGFVVIAHGIVAKRSIDGWEERVSTRLKSILPLKSLHRLRTYKNYHVENEFVAFFEWTDEEAYARERMIDTRTVEEIVFVSDGRSDLASYIQFECRHLDIVPPA